MKVKLSCESLPYHFSYAFDWLCDVRIDDSDAIGKECPASCGKRRVYPATNPVSWSSMPFGTLSLRCLSQGKPESASLPSIVDMTIRAGAHSICLCNRLVPSTFDEITFAHVAVWSDTTGATSYFSVEVRWL
jgi:hypothetical protein